MNRIYDIIGIGIGPFNLGLAALSSEINQLKTLFFEDKNSFNWHTGMMIEGARLQVPFHADLVTLANPQSAFSFLSYLKAKGRLFRFTIREEYFPSRKEYNDYCKWVASQLDNLRFGERCTDVSFDLDANLYSVTTYKHDRNNLTTFYCKKVVIGVGTDPWMPEFALPFKEVIHSSKYLHKEKFLKDQEDITIVGSGQSAAEIFSDLLEPCFNQQKRLSWITGSHRFFPMDYSKFSLEMTSPDYINYFFDLPFQSKSAVLKNQSTLFKGINTTLIDSIYNRLYEFSMENGFRKKIQLRANARLMKIDRAATTGGLDCSFTQTETQKSFQHSTQALILATGYQNKLPSCIESVGHLIQWDAEERYNVNRNYSIDAVNSLFVQNAELHTHGFNSADLGMGAYRNAIILNTILVKEHFTIEKEVPFQSFM